MSTNLNQIQRRTLTRLKCLGFVVKKHLFHLRYLFTYYIVKHMDASVFKSLSFFFSFLFASFIQRRCDSRWFRWPSFCFSLQNRQSPVPTRDPWLVRRRLGVKSLWCRVSFSGSGYWAAFEGTFLRLKLDQLTATFCRVCFAESRQNLKGREKRHEANYLYIGGNKSRLHAEIKLPFEVFHFSIDLIHFCWIHVFGEKYVI